MPAVRFTMDELRTLSGVDDVPDERMVETISMLGAEFSGAEDGVLGFEFEPNRPDLFSVEGVARALRHYLGGQPTPFAAAPGRTVLDVSRSVKGIRPFVVGGVARGVSLDDEAVLSIMSLQEKLHGTVGRDRRKVAIGVHDLDAVRPPFRYTAVEPGSVSFVPLQHEAPMTLADVLGRHEKGTAYAHLLDGLSLYPIILDSRDSILSFPPIINGALTAVTTGTRNIFIDCTGTSLHALRVSLNIVAAALAERGGTIETVRVVPEGGDPWFGGELVLPETTPRRLAVGHSYIERMLGQRFGHDEVVASLARMGIAAAYEGDRVIAEPPAYRGDILHPIDIVEDVAVGYGYARIARSLPRAATMGQERPWRPVERAFRETMVGLGFQEVVSLSLSSEEEQFARMRRPVMPVPRVDNPIGEGTNLLRASVLPSLLRLLSGNRHRPLPQRVFETGRVFSGDEQRRMAGWAVIEASAGFTDAKSIAEAVLRTLDAPCSIAPSDDPAYLPGRQAALGRGDVRIGVFGEVHPQVIGNFELAHPVIAGEMWLDRIH